MLADAVRAALADAADPSRAPSMQAYMKSAMPFHGVPAPVRRRLVTAAVRAEPPGAPEDVRAAAADLWRRAAVDLLALRRPPGVRTPALLPLLDELVVTGAWWDHVDEIAAGPVGDLLDRHAAPTADVVRAWAVDDDPWRRRAAIVCQVRRKGRTDPALLHDCLAPSVGSGWFFHRKGIGWALRAFAAVDPDWVEAFLAEQPVAPLARREAERGVARARAGRQA